MQKQKTPIKNQTIESGVQLFARIKSEQYQALNGINPKLFPEGGPFGNQVIEVVFNQEDTDYTDFLMDFIVRAILPSRLSPEFKESNVILLQSDFHMDIKKIIKVIEKKLDQNNIKKNNRVPIIEETLKRLVILNCYNSDILEISFHNLERIINNCQNPGLVVLDNCLSQYWTKKFMNCRLSFDEHCIKTVDSLFEKIKDLNVVLMYGRTCTTTNTDNLKRGNQVSYVINIVKNSKLSYTACVTNLEKNCSNQVHFNVKGGVEFF
ncbi:unnamed protein product [Ceutorhynchus assimilis]|uniref:Uncharacterized protein n=1 Tax=Ceutorhynchus assimilis TaxID=467358 RepID=A0A9N9QPY8_9CUCU|nr:unnamed protein product [Ceutorhynchus assimilis]